MSFKWKLLKVCVCKLHTYLSYLIVKTHKAKTTIYFYLLIKYCLYNLLYISIMFNKLINFSKIQS